MSLTDEYVKRALRANRAADGEGAAAAKILAEAHDDIMNILGNIGPDSTLSTLRKAQNSIASILEEVYDEELSDKIESDAARMVKSELDWNNATLAVAASVDKKIPEYERAVHLAKTSQYQGRTFNEWMRREGATELRKINTTIANGYLSGNSVSQITAEVEGIMKTSSNHVRTLVRSNILNTASIARELSFAQNNDIIDRKGWNSTLDIRTTPHICGVRDQKEYELDNTPIDHDLPWGEGPGRIHFNCRSVEYPIIEGINTTGDRPAISAGVEYERGDKTTRTGKVRKPTKRNREKGIYKVEQVTSRTRYEGWLRRQPTDFVADALGSADKAKAFKEGASLASLSIFNLGTPLNIGDL